MAGTARAEDIATMHLRKEERRRATSPCGAATMAFPPLCSANPPAKVVKMTGHCSGGTPPQPPPPATTTTTTKTAAAAAAGAMQTSRHPTAPLPPLSSSPVAQSGRPCNPCRAVFLSSPPPPSTHHLPAMRNRLLSPIASAPHRRTSQPGHRGRGGPTDQQQQPRRGTPAPVTVSKTVRALRDNPYRSPQVAKSLSTGNLRSSSLMRRSTRATRDSFRP
mmetsp:Transcript_36611/g.91703  ORF Transcript_36611/g.91703 Transcript_36611/m.91703 type:complete len:219 (-) Transcript_36611:1518-2174(-)